jgi:hypothetical protein
MRNLTWKQSPPEMKLCANGEKTRKSLSNFDRLCVAKNGGNHAALEHGWTSRGRKSDAISDRNRALTFKNLIYEIIIRTDFCNIIVELYGKLLF